MLSHRILLQSPEFAGFLESRSFDQSRLVRDVAGMASTESPRGVGVAIMAGRYLERLDLTQTHTEKTRKRIAGILQRFCCTFGGLDPHDVRTPLVSYWICHQRWALDTQLWVAVLIERVWRFGADTGLLTWNPIQGLKDDVLEKGSNKMPGPLVTTISQNGRVKPPENEDTNHLHEWVVFSTTLKEGWLMVQCVECGLHGTVDNPTSEEWTEASCASETPYRWWDNSRVTVRGHGPRYVQKERC